MKFWEAMKAIEEGKKVRLIDRSVDSSIYSEDNISYALAECSARWIDILIHYEWELYEKPQKTYTFMEVIRGLKEGKKFKRPTWKETNFFWSNHSILVNELNEIGHFLIFDDFEATDWIEVKDE